MRFRFARVLPTTLASVLVLASVFATGGAVSASANLQARDDAYRARAGAVLNVGRARGILGNDRGDPVTLISHTATAHGQLTLDADGSFTYTPADGFTGMDSFTYTVSDAVRLFTTSLPPLATIGGVNIVASAFGSSLYRSPEADDVYYGLTDRGPNAATPDARFAVEPMPTFNPAIGKFRFKDNGSAILEKTIPLRDARGNPYSGRVNPENDTHETVVDLNGTVLATDPNGYDPEGLVVRPDGTFWVSDEYGPFITHFDRQGRQTGRLSPFDNSLPAELAKRVPNRGMEGLTITPDGSTLVGMMQSALQQTDIGATDARLLTPLRIVTVKLRTGEVHEYLYLLDNPRTNRTAVSEITALSSTTFLVDERDGAFPPTSYKKIWKIDLSQATDVGPASRVPGAVYNAAAGGLLIGGMTIERFVGSADTATSQSLLAGAGITTASKVLHLDLVGLLHGLDPQNRFFAHDKVEGVVALQGGKKLVIANDSDFGIRGVSSNTPPFSLTSKIVPATGKQDDGEFLEVDLTRLPAALDTATVTIDVRGR